VLRMSSARMVIRTRLEDCLGRYHHGDRYNSAQSVGCAAGHDPEDHHRCLELTQPGGKTALGAVGAFLALIQRSGRPGVGNQEHSDSIQSTVGQSFCRDGVRFKRPSANFGRLGRGSCHPLDLPFSLMERRLITRPLGRFRETYVQRLIAKLYGDSGSLTCRTTSDRSRSCCCCCARSSTLPS
jgi:hypothetical protein